MSSGHDGRAGGRSGIKAFLIAGIRDYMIFAQERGDEAAARLATAFTGLVEDHVERHGGSVAEFGGGEALVVFGSPREAIMSAIALQSRFEQTTLGKPDLPLLVGIGLDAGEAAAMQGGYRGGAFNLAARLCNLAGPGEILASPEVARFARAVDRVRYAERGEVRLNSLADQSP
jgi:adenylate cyclase